VVREHELGTVGQVQADAVTRLKAEAGEAPRERGHIGV
jgi:hypothetical protein